MPSKDSIETEVALLTQAQDNTTEAIKKLESKVDLNQIEILKRMDKFAFVTIKEFNDQVIVQGKVDDALNARLLALELFNEKNKTGIESSTKVTSGVGKLVFAAIILAVFAAIIYFGVLVAPALGALR